MAIGCPVGYTADLTSSDFVHDSDFTIEGGGFHDARNASDNDPTSYIQNLTYCSIDFGLDNSKIIRALRLWLWNAPAYTNFLTGVFEGSQNGANWDPIVYLISLTSPGDGYPKWSGLLEFDNITSYRYYRISGLAQTTSTILAEWEFFDCLPPTAHFLGTTKLQGTGVARLVRCYVRSTGDLFDSVTSESDGSFDLPCPDSDTFMFIIAFDDDAGEQYNAIIYDRVKGVPV